MAVEDMPPAAVVEESAAVASPGVAADVVGVAGVTEVAVAVASPAVASWR